MPLTEFLLMIRTRWRACHSWSGFLAFAHRQKLLVDFQSWFELPRFLAQLANHCSRDLGAHVCEILAQRRPIRPDFGSDSELP